MKKLFILSILILFCAFEGQSHPFYVSICQVDFNEQNHTLEISVKTFADDLLMGLKKQGFSKIYLGEARENPKTDEYIFNYIRSKLKFRINDKEVDYKFIGKELESDVVWTYLEIENVNDLSKMEVFCSLLTEIYNTESNIIQVNKNGTIKNLLLNQKKTNDSLTF